MITLLWTKSNKIASRLIRLLTGEDCSHFAIVMDGRYVFHSNFLGTHLEWLSTFKRSSVIVHRMDIKVTPQIEDAVYQRLIRIDAKLYDWGAFFYLAMALLRRRIFGTPLSSQNLWASRDAYLCVELAQALYPLGTEVYDLDTVLPGQLYYLLKAQLMRPDGGPDATIP